MSIKYCLLQEKDREKTLEIRDKTKYVTEFKRATILLLLNEGRAIAEICDPNLGLACEATVHNLKQAYLNGGIEEALYDKPRSGRPAKMTDSDKQMIVATACASPPDGFSRWTLCLLTKKILDAGKTAKISKEYVRLVLKGHHIKPWREKMWCIAKLDAEYIQRMEQLWSRFEVHYTPKHASWLNQAEIGIGMYSKMCLGKSRIPNIEELTQRSQHWNHYANQEKLKIAWKFTREKARLKFKYSEPPFVTSAVPTEKSAPDLAPQKL